jgi:hypothetical protein
LGYLDVQPRNVLITGLKIIRDPIQAPVIEGEVKIAGETVTSLLVPQPLPPWWAWNDGRMEADRYDIMLSDLGNSKHIPWIVDDLVLFSPHIVDLVYLQRNGLRRSSTIKFAPHLRCALLNSFCKPDTTLKLIFGRWDVWYVSRLLIETGFCV